MTGHATAKIDRIEKAATDAGLIGASWTDITWVMDIVHDVYGTPKETRPVLVFHDLGVVERVALTCYSTCYQVPKQKEPAAKG